MALRCLQLKCAYEHRGSDWRASIIFIHMGSHYFDAAEEGVIVKAVFYDRAQSDIKASAIVPTYLKEGPHL